MSTLVRSPEQHMASLVDKIADAPVAGEHMVLVQGVGEHMVPVQGWVSTWSPYKGVGEHMAPIEHMVPIRGVFR